MDPNVATEIAYQDGFKAGFESARNAYYNGKYCIELPCKAGDVLYIIEGDNIRTCKCTGFWISENWVQIQLLDGRTFTCWDGVENYMDKTLFTDKELARKELEKQRGLYSDARSKNNLPDVASESEMRPVVHARKAESAISATKLMCTACYSDIDHDAVFCKYCGAIVDEKETT